MFGTGVVGRWGASMKMVARLCVCAIVAVILFSALSAVAEQNGGGNPPENPQLSRETIRLRELADAAQRRAAEYDRLADAAADAAKQASDPAVKESWEEQARQHALHARQQRDEAARLAAAADEKEREGKRGAASTNEPPPLPPSPSPSAGGGSTASSSGTGAASNSATPASNAGGRCANRTGPVEEPLPPERIAGKWDGENGEAIEIAVKSPGDTTRLILKGKHQWDGTYDRGRLVFTHSPNATELGRAAPDWAIAKVAGQIVWSLELDAKIKCGVPTLEGKWFPGELKFREEKDSGGNIVKQEASVTGKGKPVDIKYTRGTPEIVRVFVLEEQTGVTAAGKPKKPYPFQTSVSRYADEPTRTLFVLGFDLPTEKLEFKAEDPTVDYFFVASSKIVFGSPANLADPQRALFAKGWREVLAHLDPATARIAQGMDSMLVRAQIRGGVLPGYKHFQLNGLAGSWRLRFGDDRAALNFAREIAGNEYDPTGSLLLPERFLIEVRTDGDFPVDEIPLKLQLNNLPIKWNGNSTLVARKIPRNKAADLLRKDKGEAPEPTLYRTDFIELVENGAAQGPPERGVYHLKAKVGDQLLVTPADQFLFGTTPPAIAAPILRTPAELGLTWKDALARAARADGVEVADWRQLSGAQAGTIANLILTKPKTAVGLISPAASMLIGGSDEWFAHTRVTVGEHAALLLLRDEFVKSMNDAIKNLDQVQGEVALRGFREVIAPAIWDDNSPWQLLTVTCPQGEECPLYRAFDQDYLQKTFGANVNAAEKWSLKAVAEALGKYKQKAKDASAKAEGVKDDDVSELLRLLGYGYEALLPKIRPRMMRLEERDAPRRLIWVPELNGRYTLETLHLLAEAVQAQKDFSKLDTQMALLAVAFVTAPAMLGEGVLAACVAWGADTVFLGSTLIGEVPDFFYKRADVRFALGAHLVLGTERLADALLRETKWYELLASVAPAVVGSVVSTVRAVGTIRTARVLSKIESGGLKAFEALGDADKAAFWRQATEAKLVEEFGQAKAMSELERRSAAAADTLIEEMKAKAPETIELKPEPSVEAVGEPGPRDETKSVRQTIDVPEGTLEFGLGDVPAASMIPRENSTWVTLFEGKVRQFKLGKQLGEGTYATVFELIDSGMKGCESGCAMKIFKAKTGEFFQSGKNVVKNIERGSELLGDDIPQLKNVAFSGDTPVPYVIQQKIRKPEMVEFDVWKTVTDEKTGQPVIDAKTGLPERRLNAETFRIFNNDPGLQRAVVDLFYKIKEKGLIWEDCHIKNLYFFKDDGGNWIAGVLDQDRIIQWAGRDGAGDMGAWFGWMEADFGLDRIGSLHRSKANRFGGGVSEAMDYFRKQPGPYFKDATDFMERMFEYKGWVYYDPSGDQWLQRLLKPEIIMEKFPDLTDKARLEPLDLTQQHWKASWRTVTPARVLASGGIAGEAVNQNRPAAVPAVAAA